MTRRLHSLKRILTLLLFGVLQWLLNFGWENWAGSIEVLHALYQGDTNLMIFLKLQMPEVYKWKLVFPDLVWNKAE